MTTVDPTGAAAPPSAPAAPRRGMSTLAKVFVILGVLFAVLLLLGGLIVWSVLAVTAGPVDAANAFFATTAHSGPAVAYTLASPSFRSVVPEAQWEAYARRYGLSAYTGASWSSRNLTNNVAVLQGSLKVGGGALPATVQLTNGGSGWQVLHLKLADGGVSSGSAGDMTAPLADGDTTSATPTVPATAPEIDTPPNSGSDASSPVNPARTSTGPVIAGARLASLCQTVLAQQARATFDSIECPDSLATTPGATAACMVRKGGQSALMTVRLDTFEPATGHFTVKCKVADHPLN